MLMDSILWKGGRTEQRTKLGCGAVPVKASASTPTPPRGTLELDVPSELSQVGWGLGFCTTHGLVTGCGLPQEGDVTFGEAFSSANPERTNRRRISPSFPKRD